MSRYVRRARDQFHTVRDDVVKKQLQSVRGELRHSSRSKTSASAGSFKFSDIDGNDHGEALPETSFESKSDSEQHKSFLFDDDDGDDIQNSRNGPSKPSFEKEQGPIDTSAHNNGTTLQKKTSFDDPSSLFSENFIEEDFFGDTQSKSKGSKSSSKHDAFDDLFDITDDSQSLAPDCSHSNDNHLEVVNPTTSCTR